MKKILSLLTFFSITSAVVLSAGIILNLCIKNEPNTVLIARFIESHSSTAIALVRNDSENSTVLGSSDIQKQADNSGLNVSYGLPQSVSVSPAIWVFRSGCFPKYPSGKEIRSLVDYLAINNIDYSFENRYKLARENGITNYQGTPYQNLFLITSLSGQYPACLTSN
ncbi:MAG: hypothetical protein WC841_05760 [Candidatus Shapirobacteria bacterium]|jgi:hypothetical protein